MAAQEAVTAAQWAKAERLYPDRRNKISAIAALVGLTPIALSQEAKRRGWQLRSGQPAERAEDVGSKPPRKVPKQAPGTGAKSVAAKANPVLLVQRVYTTIDGELSKLEKQTGKTSQDRERASRALSQITNSLEKAVEMQRDIKKAMTKASGRHDKEALAHAEDLRRAIAERLERLQRQRAPGKRSGGAE